MIHSPLHPDDDHEHERPFGVTKRAAALALFVLFGIGGLIVMIGWWI